MKKLLRSTTTVVALILSVLTFVPSVAEAGAGASAAPEYPIVVSVGDENVAAFVELKNNNNGQNINDPNVICNLGSGPNCPVADPGITFIPTCGGQTQAAEAECAVTEHDPGVFQVSNTGVGRAGSECAGIVFDIDLIDAASGELRFTPQGGVVIQLPTLNDSCIVDFTFDVLKLPTIDALPATAGLQTLGIVDSTQLMNFTGPGTGILAFGRGTSAPVTVQKAIPLINTTASPSIVLGTGGLSDTAVVSGRKFPDATGTVSFRLYGPNDPTCTGTPVFEDLDNPYPQAGGPITSDAYTPTAAGTHRWVATYSGDANNNAVSGICGDPTETVDVTRNPTAITTTASGAIDLGQGQLTDSATVTGRLDPVTGGTVDFRLYGPADPTCAGTPVFESLGVPYPVAGGAVTSAAYTPTTTGVHRWVASYSGDANNLPSTGACGDPSEQTTVDRAEPTISTTATQLAALGGSMTDAATVSGTFQPTDSTIDFRLYGPDDATCAGAPVFESLGVVYPAAGGLVSSAPFTPTQPGTYRWVATYNGDAKNEPVVGVCGDPAETVRVFAGLPTIVTNASDDVFVNDGTPLTDLATVVGRVLPVDGATVDFRLYGPNDDNCAGTPVFESLGVPYPAAGGAVSSAAFMPVVAGTYRWIASYSGDANNAPAVGDCQELSERVIVRPSPDLGTELPATGAADVAVLLWTGSGMIAVGVFLVGFNSRRRRPIRPF